MIRRVGAGPGPAAALLLAGALALSCGGEREAAIPESPASASEDAPLLRHVDSPAAAGSLGPNLAVAAGRPLLSWLEETGPDEDRRHRLLVSRFDGSDWSPPAVVAEGSDFFANWADFPAVIEGGDGSLLAHWLAKTGDETYAYSIFLARSEDGGETWAPLGKLNDDTTPTEHGFVSYVAEEDGSRAFWLDGREMTSGGAMGLRTASIGRQVGPTEVLDDRVCECCATGAAVAAEGPMVVYRDRSAEEVRDVFIVRRSGDGWTDPVEVAADGWVIPGCPVNGPQIAAAGERAVAAWFTVADGTPRVELALSSDGGATFGAPRVLDDQGPFGRVDVELAGDGAAWVAWLAKTGAEAGESAEVKLRRVSPDGEAEGPDVVVARTSGSRSSGFPRLLLLGDHLYVTWVEVGEDKPRRIGFAEVAIGPARS